MKILFPTPVSYDGNDTRYLARDGGRLAAILPTLGQVGVKVVLVDSDAPPSAPDSLLLSTGTLAEWRTSDFWKGFGADAALCYFGLGSRRFLPVAMAMHTAGLLLALKLDAPFGIGEKALSFSARFQCHYWLARQRSCAAKSAALAIQKLLLDIPVLRFPRLLNYLSLFQSITAETPNAADLTVQWLVRRNRRDLAERVIILPHPVPDDYQFDPVSCVKVNRVIAIAQDWLNPCKRGAFLVDALARFLNEQPSWSACMVGKNAAMISKGVHPRFFACEYAASSELLSLLRQSKILAIASGAEGNPNVVFEAIACGCTVAFSRNLEQLRWLCDADMASSAFCETPSALGKAISREASLWTNRVIRIPSISLPPVHVSDVAMTLISVFNKPKEPSP